MRKEHVVGFISDIAWNNHDSRTGYNLPSRNTKRPEAFFVKYKLIQREITGKTKMNLTNKSWIKSVNDRRLFLDCPYQVKRAA